MFNDMKKLLNNTILFGIGSLGSKFITFLLIPLYTTQMTSSEYGYTDLSLLILNFILPIVSCALYDGVLRFLLTNESKIEKIFSTVFLIYIAISLITITLSFFISPLFKGIQVEILCVFLLSQMFYVFLSQFTKGIERNKLFSVMSIVLASLLFISSYLLFNIMDNKIDAFFYTYIISYSISVLIYLIYLKFWNFLSFNFYDQLLLKRMIKYSVPLIPNQIMWWIMNASNRIFITYFLGLSISGIYAVSSKIPALLTVFSSVFIQSWQISAIESGKEKENEKFNTLIFNSMFSLLTMMVSLILIFLKLIIRFTIDSSFYESWQYVPWLLLAFIYSNMSQFVGMFYLTSMNTMRNLLTSIYGALISIVLNVLLIPVLGANGSGISVFVSFFIVFIIRFKDTKEVSKIKISLFHLWTTLGLLIVQIYVLFNTDKYLPQIFVFLIIVIIQIKQVGFRKVADH